MIIGQGDNEQVFEWKALDIFVIPCWNPHRFEIKEEAIVKSLSEIHLVKNKNLKVKISHMKKKFDFDLNAYA